MNNICPKCGAEEVGPEVYMCGSWYWRFGDSFKQTYECRIAELENAIRKHRSQKADDRCIFDDDELYEVLGDGIKCDRQIGDKAAMLKNCERFINQRCEAGKWPSYAELEKELETEKKYHQSVIDSTKGLRHAWYCTIQLAGCECNCAMRFTNLGV